MCGRNNFIIRGCGYDIYSNHRDCYTCSDPAYFKNWTINGYKLYTSVPL